MNKILTTILILSVLGCSRKERDTLPFPLPQNDSKVGICAAIRPPKIQILADKFAAAIAEQPDWLPNYVAKVEPHLKPGTLLPYHENFGLTEAEYIELSEGLKQTTYEPVETESVTVRHFKDTVVLHFGPKLAPFNDIVFDRATLAVTTPLGKAGSPRQEIRKETKIGIINGYGWTYSSENIGIGNGSEYTLHIGTTPEGDNYFYYLGHSKSNGLLNESVECLLKFDD